jgi:ATP-binding cassette subfamily F protein uup
MLQSHAGTVFLVSHDRRFLDNVVTSTIAWEGDDSPGRWREYEGGYEDWKTQRERARGIAQDAERRAAPAAKAAPVATPAAAAPPIKPKKLSYKEQRELDALPARIEALEIEQKELAALLSSADFYADDPPRVEAAQMRVAQIDDELTEALERWEALGAR